MLLTRVSDPFWNDLARHEFILMGYNTARHDVPFSSIRHDTILFCVRQAKHDTNRHEILKHEFTRNTNLHESKETRIYTNRADLGNLVF